MTSSRYATNRNSPIDHGYAWCVNLATGLSFFIGFGFTRAWTFVYEALLAKFGETATATAMVESLHGGMKFCSSKLDLN